MDDLITLTCPSCGGKLQVNPHAASLVCQHCGTEHLIHRDGNAVTLESFARCPRCGRNDRAEKVSSIISSQTQNITSEELRTEVFFTPDGRRISRQISVPKIIKQTSELAKKVSPPLKPEPIPKPRLRPTPPKKANSLFTFGIILTIISLVVTALLVLSIIIGLFEDPTLIICLMVPVLLMLLGGISLIIFGIVNIARLKDKNRKAWSAVTRYNRKVLHDWQQANDKLMSDWQTAMNRWNDLYYCHRDDCVFIPEEGTYAPLSKIKDYLFQK